MKANTFALICAYLSVVSATPLSKRSDALVVASSCGDVVSNSRNCQVECGTDHPGGDYKSFGNTDFATCQSTCANDPQCQTAQFNGGNCYMKGTTNAASANSNVNSIVCDATPDSTQTINGVTCTVQYNKDRAGGDYASAQTGDFQTCINQCAADGNCITAQFNYNSGNCYFKNALNPISSSSNTDTVDCRQGTSTATLAPASSPTPAPTGTQQTINGRTCNLVAGYDRNGGDYMSMGTPDFQTCANACGNDALCQSAQFNTGNQVCYMKNAQNPGSASSNVDTVDCSNQETLSDGNGGTRVCTLFPRKDRAGGNLSAVAAETFQDCANSCAATSGCVTAQWNEGNSQCYMKSDLNPMSDSDNTDTVDCAASSD